MRAGTRASRRASSAAAASYAVWQKTASGRNSRSSAPTAPGAQARTRPHRGIAARTARRAGTSCHRPSAVRGRRCEDTHVELAARARRTSARGSARAAGDSVSCRRRAREAGSRRQASRRHSGSSDRDERFLEARRTPAPARSRRRTPPPPRAGARAARRRRRSGGSPPPAPPTSPGATSSPFSPSRTTSATPPTAVAITGVPTASASTTVCGKFSQLDERIDASAARKSSTIRSRGSEPRNRTRSGEAELGDTQLERTALGRRRLRSEATRRRHATRRRARPRAPSGRSAALRTRVSGRPSRTLLVAPRAARSSGSGGDGLGSTDTRSGRTPQPTASSARYALGVKTCAAYRSSASRARRSMRTGGTAAEGLELVNVAGDDPAATRALERRIGGELEHVRPARRGRAACCSARTSRSCRRRRRALRAARSRPRS